MRRLTKIDSTLGPAHNTAETHFALITAGPPPGPPHRPPPPPPPCAPAARTAPSPPASPAPADQRAELIRKVRTASKKADKPIAVLFDLQGPRIRVGDLAQPIDLAPGQT